jgi:microcystin-dependent protein
MISRRDAVLGAAAVGAAALIPKSAMADDWLVSNGQVVSRSMYPELFALIGLRYDDREDNGLTFKVTSMRGWCVDIPISWHAQGAYHAIATRPTAQANVGQIEIFFAQPLGPQPEFRRWTDEETLWWYGKRSSPR